MSAPAAAMGDDDAITVLETYGPLLTKRVHPGGQIDDYDDAKFFRAAEVPLHGFEHLRGGLLALQKERGAAVVRGSLVAGLNSERIRRLLHRDPDTGEGPTLCERAHRWIALDCEGVQQPPQVAAADLNACAQEVLLRLPAEFRCARCIVLASSSQGIKPDIRLRIWFWADRTVQQEAA